MNHDETVIALRGFGEMDHIKDIFNFAKLVSGEWFQNHRCCNFVEYKLNESEMEHPYHDLTLKEFAMLRLAQKNFQERIEQEMKKCPIPHDPNEPDPEWKFVRKIDCGSYYQEVWENRYGERCMRTVINQ